MEKSQLLQRFLYLIAFANGAILMGVEILGSRVLAPNFGNTIFVWGSLIGVFMGGMALGYYFGGWLGDRWPSKSVLALLLGLPAIYIVILPLWATPFCEILADIELGLRTGPLLASIILFLVPTIFMGAVSPFLFVLIFHDLKRAGRSVGSLYAVSTVGSIVGTIGTAFYLILWAGTRSSFYVLGGGLLVLALLAMVASSLSKDPSR